MASTAGVLADTPEFAAEEHLGRPLTLLCAVLGFVMHTLAMLPGMCATFAIMGESAVMPSVQPNCL